MLASSSITSYRSRITPSRKSFSNRCRDGVLPRLLHGHHPVKEFAREMCCRQLIVDSSSLAGSPTHFECQ